MKEINWIFNKSKNSEVSVGVKSFYGKLPHRMISELHKASRENKDCRQGMHEFDITVGDKKYHVDCTLPKYKGNNKCTVRFHYYFKSEKEYDTMKAEIGL